MEYQKYLLPVLATVKDALILLNQLSVDAQTVFAVDTDGFLHGALTDGDLRRALIAGKLLSDSVLSVANTQYKFIKIGDENNVALIKYYRDVLNVKLLPLLNEQGEVVDIINLKIKKSLLPIDAVLMAGGKGVRLRPLTDDIPKPLLPLDDKAIIDYNVNALTSYGISNVNVTVNYLKEQLIEHFKEPQNGVQIKCISEPCYLGTLGSIRFVDQFYNDTILVMNSDLFTNINYEEFYLYFREMNADMAVATIPYTISIPYGVLELDGNLVKGVNEKPSYNYYSNAGIYLIKKELLDLIPENAFFNATDFIELLVAQKYNVIKYPHTGYWIDIGKHEDYKKAQEFVKHI